MTGLATSETAAPRRVPWGLLVAAGVAFTILMTLGSWQVRRLAWKEALITEIEARTHGEPTDLATLLAAGIPEADREYRRVNVSGTFVHEAERHFLATFRGEAGYFVYTPLSLADGRFVFVNRGFVPFDRKESATRAEGQVGGQVAITGLVRAGLAEKPSALVPDNDPAKNIFYWKDLRTMAATSGLPAEAVTLDVFVDADAAPNPGGLPRGGVTIIDLPNNHLQYAVTWYGLAAALAGVVGVMLWRRRTSAPLAGA